MQQSETTSQSWASQTPVIGIGLSLGSMRSTEIIANTGFDFAMVDLLHGHFDKADATNAIRSLLRYGPRPIARVSQISHGPVNDLLDAGAVGIVAPMVESAADAQAAVAAAYYPPLGSRSKGSLAPVVHGPGYAAGANALLSLIVMIETPSAAARADEILSVPGVTACLIGASDLQFVMGVDRTSEEFLAAVDQVVAGGRRHGVAVGISISGPTEIPAWWDRGVTFFLASHDLALLNGAVRRYDESFATVRTAHKYV